MDRGLRRDRILIVSLYLVQRLACTRNQCCSSIFFRSIVKRSVNISEHAVFLNCHKCPKVRVFFYRHKFSYVGLSQGLPGLYFVQKLAVISRNNERLRG